MALSSQEIRRILGEIDEHVIGEIIRLGATLPELEAVAAHLALETDVMGEAEQPLTGRAAVVFEILDKENRAWEPDR